MRSRTRKVSIKGFLETSFVDWDGHISSVIFLGGCNFRCPFCHNRDLVLHPDKIEDLPLGSVIRTLRKYRIWVDRVVVTGGEPTINPGLSELLRLLKKEGLKVKLDTNGSFPERVKLLVKEGLVDFISMDVKGPIEGYEKWCGVSVNKDSILKTINFLQESCIDYEFRMTVVPLLHSEEDVYETARLLRGSKAFKIQAFRPINTLDPSYSSVPPLPDENLQRIRKKVEEILKQPGIKFTPENSRDVFALTDA
jgi:pyruvate formate lyase activating enzyme